MLHSGHLHPLFWNSSNSFVVLPREQNNRWGSNSFSRFGLNEGQRTQNFLHSLRISSVSGIRLGIKKGISI
jgi:hypothetical protein